MQPKLLLLLCGDVLNLHLNFKQYIRPITEFVESPLELKKAEKATLMLVLALK